MTRPILFLTDYGLDGGYVGLCHAVIARLAPDARVVDLDHSIPRHAIRAGAVALSRATRYGPDDAVWLAVVDPGVGTARRAVAVETARGWTVGPDNGLLSLAWEPLGGARRAVQLRDDLVPWPPSRTFHGRDIFAPAAALLASGTLPDRVGLEIDVETLVAIELPAPAVRVEALVAEILEVDRFGNLRLAATADDLRAAGLAGRAALTVRVGERTAAVRFGETFADVPEGGYILLVDSSGWLAVARNADDAAAGLRAAVGDGVVVSAEEVG